MKNNKLKYYLINTLNYLIPDFIYKRKLNKVLDTLDQYDKDYIFDRVDYYNKLTKEYKTDDTFQLIQEFKKHKKNTYFFDLYKYLKYFPINNKITPLFGDIQYIPSTPSLVKSRPISEDNNNSILMKLNKIRHFVFLNDKIRFEDKKDMIVWRGGAYKEKRKKCVKAFFNHPLCDIGQTNNPAEDAPWQKSKMSIEEQLQYKFILSIEGNDVATNLKWIMSSNSLAFMVKPEFETWFMEGRLIPNYHYVLLKDDYSDLEEKIEYYTQHTDKALEIISNANEYIKQFKDTKSEDLISLLVLKKYFEYLK